MDKVTYFTAFAAVMLTVACDNKVKPMGKPISVDQPAFEQTVEDSAAAPIREEPKQSEDKSSTPVQSNIPTSSHTNRSAHSDNMRSFDPASEDDMEDNGMTRYMENYDEEGWY